MTSEAQRCSVRRGGPQLAQMFFNEVVHTMVNAFLEQAHKQYRLPSVKSEISGKNVAHGWLDKVYAHIRGGSLERGREMRK